MGKRGPQPTQLRDLVFWEGLWYWVFYHLRGVLPSYENVTMNKEVRKQLKVELNELGKLIPSDLAEEDWLARRKMEIDREVKPRVSVSEPTVWTALVNAQTAEDVRKACRQSKRWLNPKWQGRAYVQKLFDHAKEFVLAKNTNTYYPRSQSGDEKRITFFARAMAGIEMGLSPNTAIDKLRKMKHGEQCPCINCDSARWDRIDRQMYKHFFEKKE